MTRGTLGHLYRSLLELEMNSVCATDPAHESVVAWDELGGMVRRIMQTDEELFDIVRQHCTNEVQDELLPLDTDFRMASDDN